MLGRTFVVFKMKGKQYQRYVLTSKKGVKYVRFDNKKILLDKLDIQANVTSIRKSRRV